MIRVVFSLFSLLMVASALSPAASVTTFRLCESSGSVVPTSHCRGAGVDMVTVTFNDSLDTVGWIGLRIETAPDFLNNFQDRNDPKLWYAAGVAEGRVSALRIQQHYENNILASGVLPDNVTAWIQAHIAWNQAQILLYPTDPFWLQVSRLLSQLQGITDGYNAVQGTVMPLSFYDIFLFNFMAEIGDVLTTLGHPVNRHLLHCSALVRVTPEDIFVAHTTWGTYTMMIRFYKDYNFGPVRMSFSGYPGMISSVDDWYMVASAQSNLAVQETTNGAEESITQRYVIPQSTSEFLRVMVANSLAIDGLSWVNTFCRYNSGTYNNQWIVVNMNLFTPGAPLADGLLWITEQMPGLCPAIDATPVLRQKGYWQSFNTPYLPEINAASGNKALYKKFGDLFSYTKYARPMIFARDAPLIKDLEGVKKFIRYNQYQTDPYSRCPNCNPVSHPCLTISCRGDLIPASGQWGNWTPFLSGPNAEGANDGKIASYTMMRKNFTAAIVSGPTWDDQPPFQWSTSPVRYLPISQTSHVGQPDLWKFDWLDDVSNELF